MIEFQCPRCSMRMRVADQIEGKARKCKGCGWDLTLPGTLMKTTTTDGPEMKKAAPKPDPLGRVVIPAGIVAIIIVLVCGGVVLNGSMVQGGHLVLQDGDDSASVAVSLVWGFIWMFVAPVGAFVASYGLLIRSRMDASLRFTIALGVSAVMFMLACGGVALLILTW